MNVIVILVGMVAAVAIGAVRHTVLQHSVRTRDDLLRMLTNSRGGLVIAGPKPMWLVAPERTFEARVGDAVVRVTFHTLGPLTTTRAQAHFAIGAGPLFHAWPGHPLFPATFATEGSDLAGIAAAWSEPVKQSFNARLRTATAFSDGTRVSVTVPGGRNSLTTLEALVDVVGQLASVGAPLLEPLTRLSQVTVTPADGPWDALSPTTLHVNEATARLFWAPGGPWLKLWMAAETNIPVGRFAIRDGAIPKLKSQLVPEHAVFWLPHLEGVSVVVTTSDIALHWPGVPTPETFIHGSELLIALVAEARRSSVYR